MISKHTQELIPSKIRAFELIEPRDNYQTELSKTPPNELTKPKRSLNKFKLVEKKIVSVNTINKPLIPNNGIKNLIEYLQVYKSWQAIKYSKRTYIEPTRNNVSIQIKTD